MTELKTKQHDGDVFEFIDSYANTQRKKEDSYELVKLMEEISKEQAKMWGDSMIGFGSFHYKSERSRQEGDWPLIAFSPRKTAISLYVYYSTPENDALLEKLGTYKMGKACIYVKKLSDIDVAVLGEIMKGTIKYLDEKYTRN